MKDKKQKEDKTKLAERKGQRPALPFERDEQVDDILLKKVRKKNSFKQIKKIRKKDDHSSQIKNEDRCK